MLRGNPGSFDAVVAKSSGPMLEEGRSSQQVYAYLLFSIGATLILASLKAFMRDPCEQGAPCVYSAWQFPNGYSSMEKPDEAHGAPQVQHCHPSPPLPLPPLTARGRTPQVALEQVDYPMLTYRGVSEQVSVPRSGSENVSDYSACRFSPPKPYPVFTVYKPAVTRRTASIGGIGLNKVKFLGACLELPHLCLVTEYMPGGNLHQLLHVRKVRLSREQRLKMTVQLTGAVAYLHAQKPVIVHRDLKTMNVVLDRDMNTKLCDFGLTEPMEFSHITRKSNGGSPRYMAPELFDERLKVGAADCSSSVRGCA
ncbi:RAC-beta serine/threonine-protein kinase-B, putative [Perkinsus marinus ATCC 50983]|uniref:RAC-beta serine/threonine-protein kinase-B, putative n=1 Tax=Perkinsus marinus (strain ATCC 50983 / TXsc) TaxID=423536 RepID=C5LQW4_PERM5|nr:RAC-beta serine/threonine-protein kinase-B, putative [Perkinsus marinus ATCC 50983]EER00849.1 RAC-beta serine/threonine-protein kinase-B, putative [Perkinsus marinus ATCC 50983]|eukprot:XP_002768131.1 RAC-beta serine/threonine-protein kinase-B, putative [Perkinsus marinus ATCC 50983]